LAVFLYGILGSASIGVYSLATEEIAIVGRRKQGEEA